MTELATTAASAREAGDAARDRREWRQAASFYQRYLAAEPDDAAIWVQLGHSLKESGRPEEAEAAYHSALALTPDDADLHLQMGHLHRRLKRMEQAVRSYTASMRLSPTLAGYRELISIGQLPLGDRLLSIRRTQSTQPLIYIKVTDFFNYLRVHKTVSGIQRVQLGIITHILAMRPTVLASHHLVFTEGSSPQLWSLRADQLRLVADYVSGKDVDHDTLKSRIATAMDGASAVQLRPGDTCIIAGSFWGAGSAIDVLRSCSKHGAFAAIYFYDLLPVTHPEFFDTSLVSSFRQGLFQALMLIDFALCISQFTTRELHRFIGENGLQPLPVEPVTLAHAFRDVLPVHIEGAGEQKWPAAIVRLQARPFVLCVCTIEIRKNHRFLFEAWKALIADGDDMPDLVLVGRRGWRVEDFMAQLETTRFLNGRIHIVHDLSDDELATLYRHCLFTVFPSFAEGWGLPIGESLSYGKLCVASNTSSMPEVGGDLVEYIDPMNLRGGIETLRRIIGAKGWIAQREAAISARFRPKLWDEVGADFIAALDRLSHAIGPKLPCSIVPRLEAGQALSLSSTDYDPFGHTQQIITLALTGGWFMREDIGIWMDGAVAGIEFDTAFSRGDSVVVLLRINVVPWASGNSLTVADAAGSKVLANLAAGRSMVLRIKTHAGESGRVSLTLTVGGQVNTHGADTRRICIGVARFGFAAAVDGGARLHLLEQTLAKRSNSRGFDFGGTDARPLSGPSTQG